MTNAFAGGAVAWVSPTYKNSRPLWRFAEIAVKGVTGVSVNRAERVIEFPSGGWLGVYSGDNDVSLRGEAFDFVIVDEAARVAGETFSDVILPTLADRNGRCLLISTPKGKNWFWQEYVKAKSDGQYSAAWQAPTAANPMRTIRKAAELAKERVSERTYRQEWLAEFIESGGDVFRGVREAATAERQDAALPGHTYVIGIDWGRTNDATVFAVLDETTKALAALDRMTDTGYALQVGRLQALMARFQPGQVLAELNSMGGPLVERLQAEGLPVTGFNTTNASKGMIIDALALALERRELALLPDETLIGELQAYESERLPGGMLRYSAPAGMHDDTVIALALAWHAQGSGWLLS